MAKIVALDGASLAWARGLFGRYYREQEVPPPERLTRREFAAFPFAAETLMRRHAAVRGPEELHRFLEQEVPRHVYYSTAYYRHPAEPSMAQKEWLGADLIFDLDADHLRGAERLDYPGQLRLVKQRLRDLVEDFLLGDFGVDPRAMEIVFSGGRGYHVHVREERFLSLSSPERRELVDYLSGQGFDPASAIERRREDGARAVGEATGRLPRTRRLAEPDAPGWRGRTTRALLGRLAGWAAGTSDACAREIEELLVAAGRAPREARREAAHLARRLVDKGGAARIVGDRELAVPKDDVPDELLEALLRSVAITMQGETDAPVTTDVHRLIRLPRSLHGGTGLVVRPVSLERLADFDPFRDATVAWEGSVPLTYAIDANYPFATGEVRARAGGSDELPTASAAFLVLRGEAELRPSPG